MGRSLPFTTCTRAALRTPRFPTQVLSQSRNFFVPVKLPTDEDDEHRLQHILASKHNLTMDDLQNYVRWMPLPFNEVSSTKQENGILKRYEFGDLEARVFEHKNGDRFLSNAWVKHGHNFALTKGKLAALYASGSAVPGGMFATALVYCHSEKDFQKAVVLGGSVGTIAFSTTLGLMMYVCPPASVPTAIAIGFGTGFVGGGAGAIIGHNKAALAAGYPEKRFVALPLAHSPASFLVPKESLQILVKSPTLPAQQTFLQRSNPSLVPHRPVKIDPVVASAGACVAVASHVEDGQDAVCAAGGVVLGGGAACAAVGVEAACAATVAVEIGGVACLCPPVAVGIAVGGLIGLAISKAMK